MAPKFRVTYDIVTFESAEHGDVDSAGFCSPGGWKHDDPADLTLREAVNMVGRRSCEDCGTWFSQCDADINYRTGEHETRAVHPPDHVTGASYRRLQRIFCYGQK